MMELSGRRWIPTKLEGTRGPPMTALRPRFREVSDTPLDGMVARVTRAGGMWTILLCDGRTKAESSDDPARVYRVSA